MCRTTATSTARAAIALRSKCATGFLECKGVTTDESPPPPKTRVCVKAVSVDSRYGICTSDGHIFTGVYGYCKGLVPPIAGVTKV